VPAGDYIDFFFQLQCGLTLSIVGLHDRTSHEDKLPYLMAVICSISSQENKTLYTTWGQNKQNVIR